MDTNTLITFIQGVGFPIVACGAMAWYVKYTQDRFTEQLNGQNERHEKEMNQVTEALNNNTEAIRLNEKTLTLLTHTIMQERMWEDEKGD